MSRLPDPNKAAIAVQEHIKTRSQRGQTPLDIKDPEDVMRALQDVYNLSDSDADELGMEVWELL